MDSNEFEIEKSKKAFRKLGVKLRRASEKFLSSVGRNDAITGQIDFSVADAQQLVSALSFEKAYFTRLATLFGELQNENVSSDMVQAQMAGMKEGVFAAEKVFSELGITRNGKEKPA